MTHHPENDPLSRYPEEIGQALDAFIQAHGRYPGTGDPEDLQWLHDQLDPEIYLRALDTFFGEVAEGVLNERVADGTAEVVGIAEDGQLIYKPKPREEP